MNNHSDTKLWNESLAYASQIIHQTISYIEFSNAMLDFFGKDFSLCKATYAFLSEIHGLGVKLEDRSKWESFTPEDLVNIYEQYLEEKQAHDRRLEFKENIDELQFLVKEYRKSDQFRKMLDFVGKFNYLAPYNAMLVHLQKEGATFVFTGKKWREYNRRPKVNAQKLITLIPFGPIQCMFDFSDTETIPNTEAVSEAQLMEEYEKSLMKTRGDLDVIKMDHLIENLPRYGIYFDDKFAASNTYGGYIMNYTEKELQIVVNKQTTIRCDSSFIISINKAQTLASKFHTLCHELGYLFCCHLHYNSDKIRRLSTKEKEFEAETVAWLVCKRCGIFNPSEEYLASYATGGVIPICSTEHIMKAVYEIEKMMLEVVNITDSLWYKEDKIFRKLVIDSKKKEALRNKPAVQGSLFPQK